MFGSEEWLTTEQWRACTDREREIASGAEVVLGFDGSQAFDATALVVVTLGEPRHLEVVELWERPERVPNWQVPILEVEEVIRAACRRYRVLEIAMDPARWQRSI